MATAAPHPFIRGTKIHGIRREDPRAPVVPAAEAAAPVTYVSEPHRPSQKKAVKIASAVVVIGLLVGGSYAAYRYGSLPVEVQPVEAAGVQRIQLAPPALVGNRIPDDYPGTYPGEQLVTYHLTPLPNETTAEEVDEDGCRWLRVQGKTEGILVYPLLGEDGQHACSDPAMAIQPETARMVGGTLPAVNGSSIRVVQIREAESGRLLAADGTKQGNSTPFLPNFADDGSTRSLIRDQVAHQLSAQGGQPPIANVASLPSQAAPARQARISTASDEDANPRQRSLPQPVVARREQARPDPRPMEPIRRAPAFVPPADDEMVPITQNPAYVNDQKVSISEGGGLRAIRPGDPPRLPGQRQEDSPGGNPLEGYASISGK